MDIEVILLLFNRPEHTSRVLRGFVENGISRIRAYLDHPRNERDRIAQEEILRIIGKCQDLEIDLVRRSENLGLAASVRGAMNEAFTRVEAAVLFEDDCVLRAGGWEFFKQGLEELRDAPHIRSLCGYLFPGRRFVFSGDEDLMLLHRFCTWGWATWQDRWAEHDEDLAEVVKRCDEAGIQIDNYSKDQAILARSERYLSGEVDIWSVNWILQHFLTNSYAVYPRESVIQNIGYDGSGKNCEVTDVFEIRERAPLRSEYRWNKIRYYVENEMTLREFMAENALKTYPAP